MENNKKKFKNEFKRRIYIWIIKLVKAIDLLPKDNTSQIIAKQVIRSGTSIGANYIEAQAGSSKKDFINFLHHSLKSSNESKFWLALLKDSGKLDSDVTNKLLDELEEISKILGSSILTAKGRK